MAGPLVAALFGLGEEFFDGFAVVVFQSQSEFLEVFDENAKDAGEVALVGDADVAPHFRRAGGDAGGVPKAVGAKEGLFFGMDRAEDVI